MLLVLLALSFAFGFVRVIIRSLQQAKTVAATIAAGELNHVIAMTNANTDEVGQLLRSLAATQEELITVLRRIKQASEIVGTGAQELSQGADNLAQRTEEQASAFEGTGRRHGRVDRHRKAKR